MGEALSLGCTCCRAATEHDVKAQVDAIVSRPEDLIGDGQSSLFASSRGQTLQCRQCGTLSFRRCVLNDCGGVTIWTVYPKPFGESELALLACLPTPVAHLYAEALVAIDVGLVVSAGAMMRAVVEAICQQFGCKGQDLSQKIANLKTTKGGPLSPAEAQALHQHRTFGNGCLHHSRIPSTEELSRAMKILNHILKTLYQLPQETSALQCLLKNPQP